MNSCKNPSKYCSLSFLKDLQNSYYISETGCDYEASEVDALVNEKEEARSEAILVEYEAYFVEEIEQEEIPFPTDEDFTTEIIELVVKIGKKIMKRIKRRAAKLSELQIRMEEERAHKANRKKFRKARITITLDAVFMDYAKEHKSVSHFIQQCVNEHIQTVMKEEREVGK